MAVSFGERMLYDKDYVKGDCVGTMAEETMVDNAVATAVSSYLIAVVGIVAAVAMLLDKRATSRYRMVCSVFFICTAVGYGVAGALTQSLDTASEHEDSPYVWFWKAAYISTLLGLLALDLIGNSIIATKVCEKCCKLKNAEGYMDIFVLLATTVSIVLILVEPEHVSEIMITGGFSLVVLFYVFIAWALEKAWKKVLGTFVMIAGMLVQVVLAPKCGRAAYADCFENCPLPAPYFNHNALFHVLFAIGLLILGVDMYRNPDLISPAVVDFKLIEKVVDDRKCSRCTCGVF